MKALGNVVYVVISVYAMWIVGTRMGIELVGLLWRVDMIFEAVMTAFFSWVYVLSVALGLITRVSEWIGGHQ